QPTRSRPAGPFWTLIAADTSSLLSHGGARRRALGVFDQRRNRFWEVGGDLGTDCRTERTRRRAAYLHPVDDPPLALTRRFDTVNVQMTMSPIAASSTNSSFSTVSMIRSSIGSWSSGVIETRPPAANGPSIEIRLMSRFHVGQVSTSAHSCQTASAEAAVSAPAS